jgi:hypothetical protein
MKVLFHENQVPATLPTRRGGETGGNFERVKLSSAGILWNFLKNPSLSS